MNTYEERQAEENARVVAMVAMMSTVAQELTKATGRPWGPDPQADEYASAVAGWTDGRLHVHVRRPSYSDEPGKITLSGRLPARFEIGRISTYKLDSPNDIRVSLSRGPVVIAKEIARRLLPSWNAYQTECERRLAAANTYRDEQRALANRLLNAAGGGLEEYRPRHQQSDNPGVMRTPYKHPSGLDVEVELHGTNGATLKVSATVEQIEGILRQLFPAPAPEMPAGDIVAKCGAGARVAAPHLVGRP